MIRMYIELDKEKIELLGGYKDTDGWYTNGTWEKFGTFAVNLENSDWFMNNVKIWLWNNKDYEEDTDGDCIEDLLEEIRNESLLIIDRSK